MAAELMVRDVIAGLAGEFMADRGRMVELLVDRVHAGPSVPGDPELRAATREAGLQIVDQLLGQLRDGADMSALQPPPAAVAYAHEYAHRGIELPVLLAVVRIGYAEFSRQWSERLGAVTLPSDVSVAALSSSLLEIFAYVDSISTAFAVAYSDERARWSRSVESLRLDIVRSIIDGGPVDGELAGQRLGHRLDGPQCAFLVWSDGEPVLGLQHALEQAAGEMTARAGASGALVVPLRGQVLAGWIATAAEVTATPLALPAAEFGVRAAVGTPGSGVDGFRSSHRQALHARRVAAGKGASAGSVTAYADVALAALASADVDHAKEFVERELGTLAAGDEPTRRIAETVRVYLEEGRSRARTSRRLGLHTNTIAYRLARAAELLGHDLDQRAAEVQVALAIAPLVEGDRAGAGAGAGS